MNFFRKYKKIIYAIIITIVLFFAYSFFFGGDNEGDQLISGNGGNTRTAAEIVGAEIIQALNQIESLKLDRAIFDDPVYRSLVDRSQPIPPEPIGKTNPFDPIGANPSNSGVLEISEEEDAQPIVDETE